MITWRGFVKIAIIPTSGLILSIGSFFPEPAYTQELKPRVVVVRNKKLRDGKGDFNQLELQKTINEALKTIFQDENGVKGLSKIITPNIKVGLKIQ